MLEQFTSRFNAIARRLGKVSPKILVGVSGGVDSIVLSDLLLQWGADFAIAHCNFSLRESAAADEQFVTYWAMNRSITLYKTTFDTVSYASSKGISIEMAARELRYDFFLRTAIQEGFDCIAVAHNANDNAETVILNLVRGSGLAGMTGMSAVSAVPSTFCYDGPIRLIRPILWAERFAIEAYAASHKLLYCTDETNEDTRYRRNNIRHNVLPLLEQINPSIVQTLLKESEIFSNVSDFASTQALALLGDVSLGGCEGLSLSRLFEHSGWQYILYVYLSSNGIPPAAIADITRLAEAYKADPVHITFSGKTFADGQVYTTSEGIALCRKESGVEGDDLKEILIEEEGEACGFTFKVVPKENLDMDEVRSGRIFAVDMKTVGGFPILMRSARQGDRMRPFGLKSGSKKISDIFTDLHFDRYQKAGARVFEKEGRIIALWPFRPDDRFKVTSRTKAVLTISPTDKI